MVRKTKEDAMATRDLILDTAECVFQQHGVAATSLQQIAQAAGLTRGAIYWHFDNKADVFDAMMQRVTLPLESVLEGGATVDAADPLGFLLRAMDNLLFKMVHDAQVRRVFEIATLKVEYVGDLAVLRQSRIKSRDTCTADLERVLALASRQGQIPSNVRPQLAARGLFALMDGILYNWLLDPQAFDLQESGHQLLVVYLRGLMVPNSGNLKSASAVVTPVRMPLDSIDC